MSENTFKKTQICLLICFFLPTILGLCPIIIEHAKKIGKKCADETGVSPDLIVQVNKNKVLPDDPKFKCYLKCFMMWQGWADMEGTVRVKFLVQYLQHIREDWAIPIVEKCGSKVGNDACDSVWLTNQCYIKEDPKSYTLV